MADNIISEKLQTEKPSDWQRLLNRGLFPAIGDGFTTIIAGIVSMFWSALAFLFGPQGGNKASGNDGLYLAATIISVIVSLFLAAISFYGSFAAASSYAEAHGIAKEVSNWIPIAIDGFVLLGVLVVFGASLVGERVGWVRFLILAFAVVSVVFNVAHIIEKQTETSKPFSLEPQHILLGAIFPIIVFLASEVTSKQISAYIERKSSLMTNQLLVKKIADLGKEKQNLVQEIEAKRRVMLADAEESIKAKLDNLSRQHDVLQSEIRKAESKLESLNSQADQVYTSDDILTAHMIGQDPDVSGEKVAVALGRKSYTFGNNMKNRIKPVLNGGLTNGNGSK